jgi:hypothetical protein
MNKGQVSFAVAGLIFGFLVGFVVAHQIYVGRGVPAFQHPPVPGGMAGSAPPMGAGGGGARSGATSGGAAPEGGAPDMATMEAVQREIAAHKKTLESDPRNLEALTHLGNLYFDAGMFDGAIEYYGRALDVEPGNVMVRTDLGTSLRRSGQPERAMREFEAAVQADPNHWRGWFNIGVVALYDLGQYERAEEAFGKVDALNPGSIDMTALQEEIRRVRAEGTGG